MTLTPFSRSSQTNLFLTFFILISKEWKNKFLSYLVLKILLGNAYTSRFLWLTFKVITPRMVLCPFSLVFRLYKLWDTFYSLSLRNAQTPVYFGDVLVDPSLFDDLDLIFIWLDPNLKVITDKCIFTFFERISQEGNISHLVPWFIWGMPRCQYVLMTVTSFSRSLKPC